MNVCGLPEVPIPVTTLIVSEQPPELAWLDFGHADIVTASASRERIWEPILDWIRAH